MSMGVNAFVYVPGSDDGGWIILLIFLGYWIFIAVTALFSNAKETIEEKVEKKEKEKVKQAREDYKQQRGEE